MSCGGTERGWLRKSIVGKQINSDRLLGRRVIRQLLLRIIINKSIAGWLTKSRMPSHFRMQNCEK